MIKELIYDLAHDKISLSQALTRSKLVASKVKNDALKAWLVNELEGYDSMDDSLPKYRKLYSPVSVFVEYNNGQTLVAEVKVKSDEDPLLQEMVKYQHMTRPIAVLEEEFDAMTSETARFVMPSDFTDAIKAPYNAVAKPQRGAVRYSFRILSKFDYRKIIELTKQKLIDTLIELDSEFPDLTNEYKMSQENNEKVNHIVTNNIYGGANSPITNAVGQTVTVGDITNEISVSQHNELEKLGVSQSEIDDLKRILQTKQEQPKRKLEIGKWLGEVLASAASKGLVESIPKITEYVSQLM